MQFNKLAALAAIFPAAVVADWHLYTIQCGQVNTGGGGDNTPHAPFQVAARINTACEQGCDVGGEVGRHSFTSGNPCNCGETLNYEWDEPSGELRAFKPSGERVAHCNRIDTQTSGCTMGAIGGLNCIVQREWNCYSPYCG